MSNKEKYYTLDKILTYNAHYNIIYGEKSNGKTTACLIYALKDYIESGYQNQLAVIRRWEEDLKGNKAKQLFSVIQNLGLIEKLTKGEYNSIYTYSLKWYLCYYDSDNNRTKTHPEPFAYGFGLTAEEHYKSTPYPKVVNILFDEFITRHYYLPDEFITFQNLLSTIIRLRTNVKIFMCGNSINKFCPYFAEMGLSNIKEQKQGSIDLYTYGDSGLTVAVEYSTFNDRKNKKSNVYFAFNNPKLKMITDGVWELEIYPHLPIKYKPKHVIYKYFIIFDDEIVQGNIINVDGNPFIYYHRKTTPIRDDNKYLVYQQNYCYKNNYRINIYKPYSKPDKLIKRLMDMDKVFYQDNEVGEIINNYLKWCITKN